MIDNLKIGFNKMFGIGFIDADSMDYIDFVNLSHKLEEQVKKVKGK